MSGRMPTSRPGSRLAISSRGHGIITLPRAAFATGHLPVEATSGSFRTAPKPDEWEEVWFAVMTCQMYYQRDERDGFRIYRSLANLSPIFLDYPHFIARTGDNVYYDRDNPRATSIDLCRLHWQKMFSLPLLMDFFRNVPSYWQKDDHDAFFDDSDPTLDAPWIKPLTYDDAAKVFREQTPVAEKLYRTFRWGRGLQIWLTENRDFRSPDETPGWARKDDLGRGAEGVVEAFAGRERCGLQDPDQPYRHCRTGQC